MGNSGSSGEAEPKQTRHKGLLDKSVDNGLSWEGPRVFELSSRWLFDTALPAWASLSAGRAENQRVI